MQITPYPFDQGYVNFRFTFNSDERSDTDNLSPKFHTIKCLSNDGSLSSLNTKYFQFLQVIEPLSPRRARVSNIASLFHIRFYYKNNEYYLLDLKIEYYNNGKFKVYDGYLFHSKGSAPREFHNVAFLKKISKEVSNVFNLLLNTADKSSICDNCFYKFKYNMKRTCSFNYSLKT